MSDPNDRINQFERALDPAIAKFAPKNKAEPSISVLIEQTREHVRALTKICDEIDAVITASESDARKAADSLMDIIKRVK